MSKTFFPHIAQIPGHNRERKEQYKNGLSKHHYFIRGFWPLWGSRTELWTENSSISSVYQTDEFKLNINSPVTMLFDHINSWGRPEVLLSAICPSSGFQTPKGIWWKIWEHYCFSSEFLMSCRKHVFLQFSLFNDRKSTKGRQIRNDSRDLKFCIILMKKCIFPQSFFPQENVRHLMKWPIAKTEGQKHNFSKAL